MQDDQLGTSGTERSERRGDGGARGVSGGPAPSGRPRWVNVMAVVGLVLLVLVVAMMLRGGHGPGRHLSGAPAGSGAAAVGSPSVPA